MAMAKALHLLAAAGIFLTVSIGLYKLISSIPWLNNLSAYGGGDGGLQGSTGGSDDGGCDSGGGGGDGGGGGCD
jgi:uncharacterized membrane protein YgcG